MLLIGGYVCCVFCTADTPFSKVKLGEMVSYLKRRDYNPIALTRCFTRGQRLINSCRLAHIIPKVDKIILEFKKINYTRTNKWSENTNRPMPIKQQQSYMTVVPGCHSQWCLFPAFSQGLQLLGLELGLGLADAGLGTGESQEWRPLNHSYEYSSAKPQAN